MYSNFIRVCFSKKKDIRGDIYQFICFGVYLKEEEEKIPCAFHN